MIFNSLVDPEGDQGVDHLVIPLHYCEVQGRVPDVVLDVPVYALRQQRVAHAEVALHGRQDQQGVAVVVLDVVEVPLVPLQDIFHQADVLELDGLVHSVDEDVHLDLLVSHALVLVLLVQRNVSVAAASLGRHLRSDSILRPGLARREEVRLHEVVLLVRGTGSSFYVDVLARRGYTYAL